METVKKKQMRESWDERNLIFDKLAHDNHTRAAHRTFNRKAWPGLCHARPHRTSGGSLRSLRRVRERETETALVAGTSMDHCTSVRDGGPRPEPQGALLGHPVPSLSPSTPVPPGASVKLSWKLSPPHATITGASPHSRLPPPLVRPGEDPPRWLAALPRPAPRQVWSSTDFAS